MAVLMSFSDEIFSESLALSKILCCMKTGDRGVALFPPLPPPPRCLDMGRRLLPPAAAVALGKALTCPPELLDLDFPEVGAATTGVDDDGDDDGNNPNVLTSTSPCPMPFFPGAPLPVVVHGALATLV